MNKILIVGGAGYVGGHLTDLLKDNNNFDIRVIDTLLYEHQYMKEVDFINIDIRDELNLKPQLDWADVVIWLAAIVGDGACEIDRKITIDVNYNSIKFLKKHFNKKIIFLSTCSVYGSQDGILTEESAIAPLSLYAETKLLAEKKLSGTSCIIFRLGTLFGLSDNFSRIRMDLVLNALVSKSITEKKINIYGGEQFRPLLHVKDVARAICLAIDQENKQGIYNLHYKNIKIIDLAKEVISKFPGTKLTIIEQEFRDTRNYKVSSEKASKSINFKAKYDIEEGINEIGNVVLKGKIKDINDPRYTNALFLSKLNHD